MVLENGDLVSGSEDSTIKIWNVDNGTVKRTLTGHIEWVKKLVMLENGDLVSCSDDTTIKIWNTENGTVKRTLTGHTEYVDVLKVLGKGGLVSGSGDCKIKFWDVETGLVKKEIALDSFVCNLEVLLNGDLVSASDESVVIWG